MAFTYWIRHEELKKYKEEEKKSPIWIKVEVFGPKDVINSHHSLSLGKEITP
jgi:hypothetical protein